MNKVRRQSLEELATKIDELKCNLEALRDEEQDYFDNMPESLQQGEKGSMAEEAVSAMEEAIDSLESAMDSVGNSAQ